MPKLIVRQGGAVREIDIIKDNFSIGRTPDNDLEVRDSLISRRHSSIVRKGEDYIVYDLGSSNGTYVNREKIEMKVLEDNDVIRVGDSEITFTDDRPRPKTTILKPIVEEAAQPDMGHITDQAGNRYIVEHVDDVARSYAFDISEALNKGISLREIRKEPVGEKADKESKMFFILFQVGKALSAAPTLDAMLQISMKLIFEVLNAERGVMFIASAKDNTLVPQLAYHRGRGIVPGSELHISTTITNQVVTEKVSIITSDAMQDPRFMEGMSIVQFNIRSALCVPLWEEQRVYGAIYLDNLAKTYAFTRDDLDLLTAIANLIASRIKQEDLREKLRKEELLRNNLAKYHSPDVVEMLVKHGSEVGLEVSEREVTVLFVDVESSTRLAEAMGAQNVAALLNLFFEMATSAIFEHKGSVNKFIGDSVMGIYNAPLEQPDHALAAVKSAVKLLKEIDRHNRQFPDRRFNIRIGINTGTVVAGNVGTHARMEYTVLGDAVNVAARFCKFPQINRIIVGPGTYEHIKGFFQVKDLGDTVIKGREKAMHAYEIVT
ncbi:MAG: FHA domain-containing protein [Planctomycetes bacterium]|nr:FHA domain-containing protein [Planctomycetota bacterium]